MPKGFPKNKVQEENKEEVSDDQSNSQLSPSQSNLIEQVASMLAEMKQEIDQKLAEINLRLDEKNVESTNKFAPIPSYPPPISTSQPIISNENVSFIPNKIPADIEKVVKDMLGDKVEMRIDESLTLPSFTLHLKIPSELSKEIVQPDIRSKTIRNIEGIDKVKEWVQMVKKNIWAKFNQAGESVPPIK